MGDGDAVRLERVAHPGVEDEGPAVLGRDERAERHGIRSLLAHRVVGESQQAVQGAAARDLGDVELLRLAVERPAAVAHPVRPRRQHDAVAERRGLIGGRVLDERDPVDGERAEQGGHGAELGAHGTALEDEGRAGGGGHRSSLGRDHDVDARRAQGVEHAVGRRPGGDERGEVGDRADDRDVGASELAAVGDEHARAGRRARRAS